MLVDMGACPCFENSITKPPFKTPKILRKNSSAN
uniref:Uncharacterized protein n=1 Tax=Arundo donax TaxID=35708 RepID=A0A0A9FCM2_ARUDO